MKTLIAVLLGITLHTTIPSIEQHNKEKLSATLNVTMLETLCYSAAGLIVSLSHCSPRKSNETMKQWNTLAMGGTNHHNYIRCVRVLTMKQCSHTTPQAPCSPALHDTLPSLPTLHHSIDTFYARQTRIQLLEFKASKKGEWLKFLPNLGITYTINGQPRPSLSISSGIFYQTQKAKQTRAAKLETIIETNRQEAEIVKQQLQELLLQYRQLQADLLFQQQLFTVETDLYLIKQDEYRRQELAPSDYLQAKRTYLLQQQVITQKKNQLDRLDSKIKTHCHY